MGEAGAGVYGKSWVRRLSLCLGRFAAVFQAEIYSILACAYEIQMNARLENCVSVRSDSQTAVKDLK